MSGESFTFGEETVEEPKKKRKRTQQVQPTPTRTRTKKDKIDPKKLIELVNVYHMVTNSIHVNFAKSQTEMLDKIIGSHKVADVRKWLNDRYAEALSQ